VLFHPANQLSCVPLILPFYEIFGPGSIFFTAVLSIILISNNVSDVTDHFYKDDL